jgi:large subunit ribosomal protein L1
LREKKGGTMGSKKNVDMSATKDTVKIVEAFDVDQTQANQAEEVDQSREENQKVSEDKKKKAEKPAPKKVVVPKKVRSKKYTKARSQVDKTRKYAVTDAVATLKKLSYSKFDGTISFDGTVKEVGKLASLTLPHASGKTIKVAIVDDALLAEIEAGNLNFDTLITTPQFMPKLAKFARVLGPKGLMPNPKNGTVTPKPELKKAELEKGTFDLKTEKKSPIIHISIGKISMSDQDIIDNIQAIMDVTKGKLLSASISATMSPSIKLEIQK